MTESTPPKKARPWDMLNKNIGRVTLELKEERLSMCRECPQLIKITEQCKKCGCHMPWKASLPHAECPIGKWKAVTLDDVSYKED